MAHGVSTSTRRAQALTHSTTHCRIRALLIIASSSWAPLCLLALCVVTQPTTVWHIINKQFVHAHLPVRCDVEGYCALPMTNRLLERWAGAFLNEKLAPLLNRLVAGLRVTSPVHDLAVDLGVHPRCVQAQAACGAVAFSVCWPLQAIAQIVALQQIAWIVSCNGDVKYWPRGAQQLGAPHHAYERHDRQQQR